MSEKDHDDDLPDPDDSFTVIQLGVPGWGFQLFFQSCVFIVGEFFFGLVMPCTTDTTWCALLYNIVQPVFFVQQYLYHIQPNKSSINIFLMDSSLCNNCLMFYDTEQVLNKGVQLFTTMHKFIQLCTCCT